MAGGLLWVVVLAAVTLTLWRLRGTLSEAHATLALLLVVVGASAHKGREVGLTIAVLSFLAFNFFLLPPYYTLHLQNPLDWSMLIGFLATGSVAALLFHRVQAARALAERRAKEAQRLNAVAAESLAAPTAPDAVSAVARVTRAELALRAVYVFATTESSGLELVATASATGDGAPEPGSALLGRVVEDGRAAAVRTESAPPRVVDRGEGLASLIDGAAVYTEIALPLAMRERLLGVVVLRDPDGISLDAAGADLAEGLARHAALALERMRLAREADHAVGLREADRLKDSFIASVSHDLRTPLTTVRALAAELREAGDERAVIIEEEAERLNRMVGDLLDLSRVRTGSLPLDLQLIAAEDVVGAALQRIGGVRGSDRIVVRLPADGTLPVGRMDFVQTLRCLVNLLENALRHAPEGSVEFQVDVEGDDLCFRVLDRGPGMAGFEAERMSGPMVADASGKDGRRSSGLGLGIARGLAEAQGGSLRYSPRPGGGSVFTLRLAAAALPDLGG